MCHAVNSTDSLTWPYRSVNLSLRDFSLSRNVKVKSDSIYIYQSINIMHIFWYILLKACLFNVHVDNEFNEEAL